MASSKTDGVENSVICGICHELFEDPRLLPCSHTYCRKCLEETASVNKNQVKCPFCNECKILKKDISSLPLNRSVHDLVELYDSMQRSNLCTNCYSVLAECACDRCQDESFCTDCYELVHAPPVMKKHERVSINDKPTETIHCTKHTKKILEYWCYTCTTIICIDCLLFEHKEHNFGLLDDVAKEYQTNLNIHLHAIESSLKYRLDQVERLIHIVDSDSESNRVHMREVMTSLRKTIDEHEKSLVEQIRIIEREQKTELENYKIPLKTQLQNLDVQKATFDILLANKHYAKLLQTKKEFDDYLRKTNETLQTITIPIRTEYYSEGLDQLQIIKERIVQCGRYVEVLPQSNPQLEKIIETNQTKQELDLTDKQLTDKDVKVLADSLRKNNKVVKLHLNNCLVRQEGAQQIADMLKTNQTLVVIGVSNNQVGQHGTQHIAEALKTNKTLTTLYFRENQIGQEGARYIAEALIINSTLTTLYISNNQIGQQGARYIAEVLKTNRTLNILGISHNQIGQKGGQYIAEALKTNQTLSILGISNNQLGPEGARHFAEALKTNKTMTILGISSNQMGPEGIQHMAEALKTNNTIIVLGIKQNKIGQRGAPYIAEALKFNKTLTKLYLRNNEIGQEGRQIIEESLKTNTNLTVYW